MRRLKDIVFKMGRRWTKFRLQPIHVFCLHHVCATYDAESMHKSDWMQIDEFKSKVSALQKNGVEFISLLDAHHKISNDKFRKAQYAVLTFDDGYASLKEVLPWLNEQRIPVTLFLNPAYFDGKHYREKAGERYLTENEVQALHEHYPLLTIGSHGWNHSDIRHLTKEEFEVGFNRSVEKLHLLPNYIPYYAFTYGLFNQESIRIVWKGKLIPVLVSGNGNYNNAQYIDRELL